MSQVETKLPFKVVDGSPEKFEELAAWGRKEIELAENEISDLAPLAGLTELQLLSLAGNRVSDLAPLAGLDQLRTLGLGFNALTL